MDVNNLDPEAVRVNVSNLAWARNVADNPADILRCEELFDQLRNNVLATGAHQIQIQYPYGPHPYAPRMINIDDVHDVNALCAAVENLAA